MSRRLKNLLNRLEVLKREVEKESKKTCNYYNNNNNTIPLDFVEFNRWLGLPMKDGKEHDIYPYELDYYNKVKEHRLVIVNKATGIGMTEITLRLMLHAALTWNLGNKRLCIVSGTRLEHARELLNRLEGIITRRQKWLIKSKDHTSIMLFNGYFFKVYPAVNIDAIRGLDDVSFIFVDEAAFFRLKDQNRVRDAIERYVAKTYPFIVWVSTPRGRAGAFYEIYSEALEGKNSYYALTLPYMVALNMLLDEEHIELQKRIKGRLFMQEYCCKFIESDDSIFSEEDIKELII
jgi:hypothetical protein